MKKGRLALLSAAHFWVDFSCALLLLGKLEAGLTALLLYNFMAFAVQMPLGVLADRIGGRWFAALGCLLCAGAWWVGGLPAVLLTGLGNALFHVGGGLYAMGGKGCGPLGIFVSPGALGIFFGGVASVQAALPAQAVWIVLLALAAASLPRGGQEAFGDPGSPPAQVGQRIPLAPVLCLFAVVLLRSWVGTLFTFPWKSGFGFLMALAVAGGKAAGGLLADRFGVQRTASLSLGISAVCFLFAQAPMTGVAAVCTFNMTMPLTLWGLAQYVPKGAAFGTCTFALFLGVLPVLLAFPMPSAGWLCVAGAACSLPLLAAGLREGRKC